MDMRTMLLQAAERNPDTVALSEGQERLTYHEWNLRVVALADSLHRRGIRHADRVAIGMRNSIDHATAFFATQMLGAVAVPFNFRFKEDGISYILANSGARAVMVDENLNTEKIRSSSRLSDDILWIRSTGALADYEVSMEEMISSGGEEIHNRVDSEDLSAIIYTSGTTGRPKGVPITHGNSYSRLVTYIMTAGPAFDSGARTLGAAPLYHTVGMHWVFLQTVFVNGTYFPVARVDEHTLPMIRDERLTFLFGSPTLFRQLLSSTPGADPIETVTEIAYGSAPAEPELLQEMSDRFPNAKISEVYGTTELSIPFVTGSMAGRLPGTLRPTGDFRIRLVEPGGGPDETVSGENVGELLVEMSNPGIFKSYWGDDGESKTAEKVEAGWFHTGDAFWRDEDGSYYFKGRLDDMFVSGGENIQPAEVENMLNGHPGISEVAVIGTPDPKWGQVVTAFIVLADRTLTETAIDAYARQSTLDDFKRPRKFVFLDEIPRNPSGKIVRPELKSIFYSGQAGTDPDLGQHAAKVSQ
ncbi:class I adenylate-forming enzyme family protein [Specibacter sp. RAF43]|uniref:class I adenylate-forming enzyme family protein n=1 Tax=Specibacter sp. RAF43 TaxID=3233057 RepID=UPI003F9B2E8A